MVAPAQAVSGMSVDEFLDWNSGDTRLWQLIDGEPWMMAPASIPHGMLQAELGSVIRNHLLARNSRCRVVITPGVIPPGEIDNNLRIPDLAVICIKQPRPARVLLDPILIVEILLPSNEAETWGNVSSYTRIPSLREVVVLRTDVIGGYVLRGEGGQGWPSSPGPSEDRAIMLDSIGLRIDLAELYRGTPLDPDKS